MLEIEIVESNIIDGGVEVFARAWRDGVQIGFGKDGSVDIERFRFINPPILVPDPNGTVIGRTGTHPLTGEVLPGGQFREDPEEAILQMLEHNISLTKHDDSNIIPGKIGNTTSTYNPDANPETSSVDGYMDGAAEASYSAARAAATSGGANDTNTVIQILCDNRGGGTPYNISRSIFVFDTSDIPDTDTVSSATLSLYEDTAFAINNADSTSVDIVQSAPASDTAVVVGDFDSFTFTSLASIDLASISTSAYNDFSLNDTSVISKTGATKLGAIIGLDLSDSTAPTGDNRIYFESAEGGSGTTIDPKLVVEHAAAASTFTPKVMFF